MRNVVLHLTHRTLRPTALAGSLYLVPQDGQRTRSSSLAAIETPPAASSPLPLDSMRWDRRGLSAIRQTCNARLSGDSECGPHKRRGGCTGNPGRMAFAELPPRPSYHLVSSAKKGFDFRSFSIVVVGPCPQWTMVSPGSVKRWVRMFDSNRR